MIPSKRDALVRREDVALIGFGVFTTAVQKGKEGTIPGTQRTYKTEDKIVPKFKASSALKSKVEGE